MQRILRVRYYNVGQEKESRYLIQTQSQAKTSGKKLPAVHGVDNRCSSNCKARKKKQILKPIKLEQGRAGLRRKMKIPVQIQPQIQTSGVDQLKEQTLPNKRNWCSHP